MQSNIARIMQETPHSLRSMAQWICWRYIERNGRTIKYPISPVTGQPADITNPAHWAEFNAAIAAYERSNGELAGVGFVFRPGGGICGIDLDSAIDPTTGAPKPWAQAILQTCTSYAEVSPSGSGVKIFLRASKPPGARCRKAYCDGEVEIYDRDRFFVVTGMRLPTAPEEVMPCQAGLERVYRDIFNRGESVTGKTGVEARL